MMPHLVLVDLCGLWLRPWVRIHS
eukprot:SAG11_NODE_47197_length_131_cov_6.468750_1_plen_23_part_10